MEQELIGDPTDEPEPELEKIRKVMGESSPESLEIKPPDLPRPVAVRPVPEEELEFAELKGDLIDLTFVYTDFEETELGYVFILPEKKDVGLVPKKPMRFELHLLGKDPVTVLYAIPPTFFSKLGLKLLWLLRDDEEG